MKQRHVERGWKTERKRERLEICKKKICFCSDKRGPITALHKGDSLFDAGLKRTCSISLQTKKKKKFFLQNKIAAKTLFVLLCWRSLTLTLKYIRRSTADRLTVVSWLWLVPSSYLRMFYLEVIKHFYEFENLERLLLIKSNKPLLYYAFIISILFSLKVKLLPVCL